MKDIMELADLVRQTADNIHCYLRASRMEHGLLMNFGARKFEIRKYALSQIEAPGSAGRAFSFLLSLFAVQ